MTDSATRPAAAVKFKWQKDEKTYDYFIPDDLELSPGDKVMVETKRGETEVEVIEVKKGSERAEKEILRRAEPKAEQPATADDWNF
jgi:primosomal protein N'